MLCHSSGVQALFGLAPAQLWKFGTRNASDKQPRPLASKVPVVPLVHAARPQPWRSLKPSACTYWLAQSEGIPCVRVCRVFKHSAKPAQRFQRSSKTPTVVAHLELVRLGRAAVPETAPALAWWVRHYRVRALVGACVSRFVPRVNAWYRNVGPVCLDVQCCHRTYNRSLNLIRFAHSLSPALKIIAPSANPAAAAHPA